MLPSIGTTTGYLSRHYASGSKQWTVLLHRETVEQVLGKPLASSAVVHHVNDDRQDNRPSNLVVLQNRSEHLELHYRRRVLRAGGDPWTQRICATCRMLKAATEFYLRGTAFQTRSGGHPTRNSCCKACCMRMSAQTAARARERRPVSHPYMAARIRDDRGRFAKAEKGPS